MLKKLLIVLLFTSVVFATVTSPETKRQYFTCNGSTTTFTFTAPCNSSDDIKVYKRLISDGNEGDPLTEDTDYTITNTGSSYLEGGVVTIDPALASTYQVVILREIVQTQETVSGAITPVSVEAALDKLTRQIQDIRYDLTYRYIRIPQTDADTLDMEYPNSISRADKNATFDSDGNPTATDQLSTGSANISAFGETLIDDADAATARATLELDTELGWINIGAYGAVGDTITDDGPAVASAFAALVDGDVLAFPAGTYTLTTYTVQTITANITIVGAGKENTTIVGPDTSTDFLNLGANGNIVLKDIGFSTFNEVVHGTTEDTDYIEIYNCKADSLKKLYGDVGFATTGDVDRFIIHLCRLSNISDVAIDLRSPITKFVSITDSDFDTITGAQAIRLGSNDATISNNAYIIAYNYFKDISGGTDTHAILCYGKSAIIANNVINSVSNVGGEDCEGIYTKCIISIIIGNTLYDASENDSAIRLKGQERTGDTAPFGHSNIVANNNIYYSTEYSYVGINTSVSDILIIGNYIENAEKGIASTGKFGVNISNNIIYNIKKGIQLFAVAAGMRGCSIIGNTIRETNDDDVILGVGIQLDAQLGAISNILINDNLIDTVKSSGTSIGIDLQCDNNISYLSLGNNLLYDMDNGIDVDLNAGTLTYVLTTDNMFSSVTGAVIDSNVYSGTGSIIKDNLGFLTENSGVATLLNANTTIAVAHGLATTPTVINIAWRENPTNVIADWWIDTIGAANFTLNGVDPGASNLDFGWEAKVR